MSDFKVLIIEDEDLLREVLVESLELYGLTCIDVANGKEALDYLNDNNVDFVVTDVQMPEMDGITFLKKIRDLNPEDPPVLVVTGFSDIANEDEAKEIGAIGMINKPYNVTEIYNTIQKFADKKAN